MPSLAVQFLAFVVFSATAATAERDENRRTRVDEMDHLRSQVELLREELRDCPCRRQRQMGIQILKEDNEVACNDGSPAGYYLRPSGSKRWVIYLEGGGYCYDSKTCNERFRDGEKTPLKSSNYWDGKKDGSGILSPDIENNPTWWNANAVLIPYCSSDLWSGNQSPNSARLGDDNVFMGSRIITSVVRDLLEKKGMANASQILLAGSSAGGVGVMLNVDRVARQVKRAGCNASVRGLADSGWFVDCKGTCAGKKNCPYSASNVVKQGYSYWNATVPRKCLTKYSKEPWKCFFGDTLYRFIETPIFVSQWLYDDAQRQICNIPYPKTKRTLRSVQKLGSKVRQSLKGVSHSFAAACLSHNLIVKKDWGEYKINGQSLPEMLDCWFPTVRPQKSCGRSRCVDNCDLTKCDRQCPSILDPYIGVGNSRNPLLAKGKKSEEEGPMY